MAKITVCDICRKEGKTTETTTYMKVRHHPDLRLDYCSGCKPLIPKPFREYIRFVYETNGISVSEEQLDKLVSYVR